MNEETVNQSEAAVEEKKEAPHLSESELLAIHQYQKSMALKKKHDEWKWFQKMSEKPKKQNFRKTFDENGKVVRAGEAFIPMTAGNIRSGKLRNKKCSCGSNKKFKFCCLSK
jgi:uncharacterized protein YchJ